MGCFGGVGVGVWFRGRCGVFVLQDFYLSARLCIRACGWVGRWVGVIFVCLGGDHPPNRPTNQPTARSINQSLWQGRQKERREAQQSINQSIAINNHGCRRHAMQCKHATMCAFACAPLALLSPTHPPKADAPMQCNASMQQPCACPSFTHPPAKGRALPHAARDELEGARLDHLAWGVD